MQDEHCFEKRGNQQNTLRSANTMLTVLIRQVMYSIWILPFAVVLLGVHSARIEENGYRGITISFSDKALQMPFDFENLKDVLRDASEILFYATRKRSYFEEFVLVIPSTWENYSFCDEDAKEAPESVDVHVTDSAEILSLTAQHSKGCGEKGDIIYMPIDWLTGDDDVLSLQFVQRWSTFRYGVFPENPERPGSCVATSDSSWSPTGCYNIDLKTEASFDEDGLPVCYFPDDFREKNLRSSIMFSSNTSTALHFCEGSHSFPHNPVAPTVHNRICEGYPVWSIVKNTEDFRYSRNLPVENAKPLTFRCFKESKTHMTLAVQDTDSQARTEIRYALFYFLSNLAAGDLNVSLVTFSNDTLTDAAEPLELDLLDETKLKSHLVTHVKLNKQVPNVCLICGLRKAYKVSEESQNPLRVIVLFAQASSLQNSETSELTEFVRSNYGNAVLYLLFLEDTDSDVIPSSLVDAIQDGRGRIFRVKNDQVFVFAQMNIALLDVSKNILHTEDKIIVVHQKTRVNVVSSFRDVFVTPKNVKGKLLYSMQCKKRGELVNENNGCSILDQELQSPICESKLDLKDEDSPKIWKYSFQYMAGSEGTTCVSLALLKLDSPSTNSFFLNGWLNQNKITPGQNALIIYAEVIGRKDANFHVEALISGPGLTGFRLELRDNGNGDPDIVQGDHIYSRYFTSFTQKGTYTVSIVAALLGVERNIPGGNSENAENMAAQTKVIGSFMVTEPPPKEDIIPPNRVLDLDVISIDSMNKTVVLQWTAPGDNYDDGRAKKYIIKLSNHWMSLLDFTFDLKENIVINADEYLPGSSGTTEDLRIQCLASNYNTTYYLALKATDDKGNKGKISNIIQIYFMEAYIPSNDSVEISTDTSNRNGSQTSSPFVSTDVFSTPILPKNNTEENTTVTTTTDAAEGIFIEKRIIIIAASTTGVIIIILIIISAIICYCCFRRGKNSAKPKKISRKASLRPPYNLNIAYRHGSQSSLDENPASNSMSTLVDHSTVYSSSDGRRSQAPNNYTYHTNQSLVNKMDNQNIKNDLGFQPVQPLPAYATSSLSRFASRRSDMHLDPESSRSDGIQHQTSNNVQDTQVYSLGEV